MSATDLIRRDAALDALARVGILPDDAAMDAVREVPADPVGEAAGRLAECVAERETAATNMQRDMETWRSATADRKHVTGQWADKSITRANRAEGEYHSALYAYRAAVSARDAKEPR